MGSSKGCARRNPLHGHAVHFRETSPQRVVAADHLAQGLLQGLQVHGSLHAHRGIQAVRRPGRIQLIQEPQRLLGQRQRKRLRLLRLPLQQLAQHRPPLFRRQFRERGGRLRHGSPRPPCAPGEGPQPPRPTVRPDAAATPAASPSCEVRLAKPAVGAASESLSAGAADGAAGRSS